MRVLTTLVENHYFLGFSALLNSLVDHGGCIDKVIAGYRYDLPTWLPPLTERNGIQTFTLPSGIVVDLVKLDGDGLHMVHEKPAWCLNVQENLAPEADEYYFFDSDITIDNRMSFYSEWLEEGVAICGDVNFVFDATHPARKKWAKAAEAAGHRIVNNIDSYYNSGFLGWRNDQKQFIHDWMEASRILSAYSGDMKQFRVHDRTYMVLSTNQDGLNLAIMITEEPISLVGPDGMGFTFGMQLMQHPIGKKPWKRNFILDFIKGYPPRKGDLTFWKAANGSELAPYSAFTVRRKVVTVKLLKLFARFYQRSGATI